PARTAAASSVADLNGSCVMSSPISGLPPQRRPATGPSDHAAPGTACPPPGSVAGRALGGQLAGRRPMAAPRRLVRPRGTLPAAVFWAPQEIAIDPFHDTFYAAATGIAISY